MHGHLGWILLLLHISEGCLSIFLLWLPQDLFKKGLQIKKSMLEKITEIYNW
jgi:hypothetical protein